jgi:hypothetical protein
LGLKVISIEKDLNSHMANTTLKSITSSPFDLLVLVINTLLQKTL